MNQDRDDDLSGTVSGAYRIERRIGRGGMGDVYRAVHTRLGQTVAIKSIALRFRDDERAQRRFAREMRLACRVSHPYVAKVFDVIEEGDRVLLVLEFVEGRSLARALADDPEPQERLRWAIELAEALAAVHRAGLVHRDLKPANVMVAADGHVKLLDFGLARRVLPEVSESEATATADSSLTASGTAVGTPRYMAPEQLRGEEADARSDLFSFGVLLYELLTGAHPFARATPAESAHAAMNEEPAGGALPVELASSGRLQPVLARLLAKAPEARYARAEELLADLRAAEESLRDERPRRSFRSIAGLAAAGLVAIVGLLAAAWWWGSRPPVWERPRISMAIVAPGLGAETDVDPIDAALFADLLATELEASAVVRALGPGRTEPIVRNVRAGAGTDAVAAAVRTVLGADYVLVGQLYRRGDGWTATLEFPQLGEERPSIPALRVEADGIDALADRAATRIRGSLPGVPRLTAWRDDRQPVPPLSPSTAALAAYEGARRAEAEERLNDALDGYRAALDADPGFALARARMALCLDEVGYARRAREEAARAASVLPGGEGRGPRRVRWTLEAIRARLFNDPETEIDRTGKLVDLFPDEAPLHRAHASALRRAQRHAEALARLDMALALEPGYLAALVDRIAILEALGRFEEAMEETVRSEIVAQRLQSDEAAARIQAWRGVLFWDREDYTRSEASLRVAVDRFADSGRAVSAADTALQLAKLQLSVGRPCDGDSVEQALAWARERGNGSLESDARMTRGYIAARRGEWDASIEHFSAAVDVARRLENRERLVEPISNLIAILVELGRRDDARALIDEALDAAVAAGRPDAEAAIVMNVARMEWQDGRVDIAIGALERRLSALEPDELNGRLGLQIRRQLALRYMAAGRLLPAREAADLAHVLAREIAIPAEIVPALIVRATVATAAAAFAPAERDLRAARELIEGMGELGLDYLRRTALVETWVLLDQGNHEAARRALERAGIPREPGAMDELEALLSCRAWSGSARSEAMHICASAAENPDFPEATRIRAEAYRLSSIAGRMESTTFDREVRVALARAGQAGLPVETAQLAALHVRWAARVGIPVDRGIRQSGIEALRDLQTERRLAYGESSGIPAEERSWARILNVNASPNARAETKGE